MIRQALLGAAAVAALAAAPASAVTYAGAGFAIPDGDAAGISRTISIAPDSGFVSHMDLSLLDFGHTWIGDVSGRLTHAGVTVDWLQRTNVANSANVNGDYTFRDGAPVTLDNSAGPDIAPGLYAPDSPFVAFDGTPIGGDWTLTMADNVTIDHGQVGSWGLNIDALDPDTILGSGGRIPDGDSAGITSHINLTTDGLVDDLSFAVLGLQHTWIGDLTGTLSHGGVTATWLQRFPNDLDDLLGDYTFRDDDGLHGITTFGLGSPIPSGTYHGGLLSAFHGMAAAGDWTLHLTDAVNIDTGRFNAWTLDVNTIPSDPGGGVPEPASWALMIAGFGLVGAAMRRRRARADAQRTFRGRRPTAWSAAITQLEA